jgi:hypothetical protein
MQKLWVPVVLLTGLILGELISITTMRPSNGPGPGQFGFPHQFPAEPFYAYHVVLTTIGIVLLISLVVIYAKMYAETKANFALGLVVVLVALLIQAFISYPLVDIFFFIPSIQPGLWSQAADIVTVCAYTIFLYLSLE